MIEEREITLSDCECELRHAEVKIAEYCCGGMFFTLSWMPTQSKGKGRYYISCMVPGWTKTKYSWYKTLEEAVVAYNNLPNM